MKNSLRIAALVGALLIAGISMPAAAAPKAADVQRKEERVAFNTKTLKYHRLTCRWAARCTKNCITIPLSEAIKRGGIPCKICGGS